MTVLVTGGTGIVGGAVVRHLVAAGREVRGLARDAAGDVTLEGLGAEPVRGDVLDPAALRGAVEGAEVVYHLAGINSFCLADPAPMMRTNIEGSRQVVAACLDRGVRRLVYTSSAATLGEVEGTVGHEGSPHRGSYLSEYEKSKHLAEQAVLATAEPPLEVVTVNPSSAQGPGRATGTGKVILDLINGKLPAVVHTRFSIVDIDDCARGHLLAEEHGTPGERYVLNGFTLTMEEAVARLAETLGREIKVRYAPGRWRWPVPPPWRRSPGCGAANPRHAGRWCAPCSTATATTGPRPPATSASTTPRPGRPSTASSPGSKPRA